jgi:hypothetical protein
MRKKENSENYVQKNLRIQKRMFFDVLTRFRKWIECSVHDCLTVLDITSSFRIYGYYSFLIISCSSCKMRFHVFEDIKRRKKLRLLLKISTEPIKKDNCNKFQNTKDLFHFIIEQEEYSKKCDQMQMQMKMKMEIEGVCTNKFE